MRIQRNIETQEFAGGLSATSAHPRHATPSFTPRLPSLSWATSQLTVSCLWNNRRTSGEPPLLAAFHPLPGTLDVFWKTLTKTKEFTMIANALLFTIVILFGYGFWLLDQLKSIARYKAVL